MNAEILALNNVIGEIYQAALRPADWPVVLESICNYVGADKATLLSYEFDHFSEFLDIQFGYEENWIALYKERYAAGNPLQQAASKRQVLVVDSVCNAGVLERFVGTPMYEEWVKPQGISDVAEVVLDRSGKSAAALALCRHIDRGPFDSNSLDRFRLIAPHVRRSVIVSRVLSMYRLPKSATEEVFEALASPAFIIAIDRGMVRANAEALKLLEFGEQAVGRDGRLHFVAVEPDAALGRALRALAIGESHLKSKALCLQVDATLSAHLLPLNSEATVTETYGPCAALFLRKASPKHSNALLVAVDRYGLTTSEARTLAAVIEIGSTPLVAEAQGLSVATVRTHLRNIFAKTGVRRQTDLLRLMISLESPFADG